MCPSCYQDIEDEADIAGAQYSIALNKFLALRYMLTETGLGPFNPRFVDKQAMVENINAIINALSIRESNLTAKYNLLNITMQAVELQSVTIQMLLNTIQRSSTTVLILGSTSRELIDRIKSDFFIVNTFLDIIRNDIIPSIQLSSDRIQTNVDKSINISQIFTQTLQSISDQIFEIQTNLLQISFLVTNTQEDLENIHQLLSNTSEVLNDVYEVHGTAVTGGSHITSMINDLSSNLQLLKDDIYQLQTLPNSKEEEANLRNLLSLSLATENDVNVDILGELSNQLEQLYTLNETLTIRISQFGLLESQLANDKSSAVNQNERAQYFQTEIYQLADSVTQQINIAKTILQNLQNFSNNSLEISSQADIALQHVKSINETAMLALSEAKQLQQRIFQLNSKIETKQSIIVQTSDLISSIQQVC